MTRQLLVTTAVLLLCETAIAQAPFVGNHYDHLIDIGSTLSPTSGYVDIPETIKTFTLPVGRAVFSWSFLEVGSCNDCIVRQDEFFKRGTRLGEK